MSMHYIEILKAFINDNFDIFCSKHRLWVQVITASLSSFVALPLIKMYMQFTLLDEKAMIQGLTGNIVQMNEKSNYTLRSRCGF